MTSLETTVCCQCGACADACPTGAIRYDEDVSCYVIHHEECIDCGACEKVCPQNAGES